MSQECPKCNDHCYDCGAPNDQFDSDECNLGNPLRTYHVNMKLQEKFKMKEVNHPYHYQGNSLEAIDIIEDFDLNFCLGNALKYILRAGKKEDVLVDLKKSIWYLEREIQSYE